MYVLAGLLAVFATQDVDLVVLAREIWTGNPAHPTAQGVAVRDGKIVAVGTREEIQAHRGPRTRVLEFADDLVTPGLVDAHGHLTSLGGSLSQLDVRGAKSASEVAQRVRRWADEHPDDPWIIGRNWDQSLWPEMQFPTAAILDDLVPDRPVWLSRVDGHAGWANSEAMRRANISKATQAPADGQILRDGAENPTGVFVDGATTLIESKIPPPTPDKISQQILATQAACLKLGLTGVHDAGMSSTEAAVFRSLDQNNQLKLRVYAMASPGADPVAFASRPPQTDPPGARFTMRAIKLYADGAMGSRGALLFEPYADDAASTGLTLIDPKTIERATGAALKNGWQICTHAIGDKANAQTIAAYEAALRANPTANDARLRIEHAQVIRKADVARFKELGVIASMQPSHVMTDQRWADVRLGAGSVRVQGAYAWRWFLDAGVPLAAGSDFPVEVPNPLRGLFAATTRKANEAAPKGWHADQCMTVDEALRAFTAGPAFAAFSEQRLGRIAPGFDADFTVIAPRGFDFAARRFIEADDAISATIIAGEVVYQRP